MMLQSSAMKITLQTLHSNQLCDPIEPLPPLESEPIATLLQGVKVGVGGA